MIGGFQASHSTYLVFIIPPDFTGVVYLSSNEVGLQHIKWGYEMQFQSETLVQAYVHISILESQAEEAKTDAEAIVTEAQERAERFGDLIIKAAEIMKTLKSFQEMVGAIQNEYPDIDLG